MILRDAREFDDSGMSEAGAGKLRVARQPQH